MLILLFKIIIVECECLELIFLFNVQSLLIIKIVVGSDEFSFELLWVWLKRLSLCKFILDRNELILHKVAKLFGLMILSLNFLKVMIFLFEQVEILCLLQSVLLKFEGKPFIILLHQTQLLTQPVNFSTWSFYLRLVIVLLLLYWLFPCVWLFIDLLAQ